MLILRSGYVQKQNERFVRHLEKKGFRAPFGFSERWRAAAQVRLRPAHWRQRVRRLQEEKEDRPYSVMQAVRWFRLSPLPSCITFWGHRASRSTKPLALLWSRALGKISAVSGCTLMPKPRNQPRPSTRWHIRSATRSCSARTGIPLRRTPDANCWPTSWRIRCSRTPRRPPLRIRDRDFPGRPCGTGSGPGRHQRIAWR